MISKLSAKVKVRQKFREQQSFFFTFNWIVKENEWIDVISRCFSFPKITRHFEKLPIRFYLREISSCGLYVAFRTQSGIKFRKYSVNKILREINIWQNYSPKFHRLCIWIWEIPAIKNCIIWSNGVFQFVENDFT